MLRGEMVCACRLFCEYGRRLDDMDNWLVAVAVLAVKRCTARLSISLSSQSRQSYVIIEYTAPGLSSRLSRLFRSHLLIHLALSWQMAFTQMKIMTQQH